MTGPLITFMSMEIGGTTYAGGRLGLFDENPP